MAEWTDVAEPLGEILAGQEEFDRFFAQVLTRFDDVLAELTREQQRWQEQASEKDRALRERAEELDRQRRELEEARAKLARESLEIRTEAEALSAREARIEPLLKSTQQEQAALREALSAATSQISGVVEAVAKLAAGRVAESEPSRIEPLLEEAQRERVELREALAATTERIAQLAQSVTEAVTQRRSQEQADAEEDARRQIRRLEEERAEARQEQTVLETELEAVRCRAAELAEALDAQKREAAEQHAHWVDELRRQRLLLESVAECLAQRLASVGAANQPAPTAAAPPARGVHAADSALESVMAQFEILQRDVARRRSRTAGGE